MSFRFFSSSISSNSLLRDFNAAIFLSSKARCSALTRLTFSSATCCCRIFSMSSSALIRSASFIRASLSCSYSLAPIRDSAQAVSTEFFKLVKKEGATTASSGERSILEIRDILNSKGSAISMRYNPCSCFSSSLSHMQDPLKHRHTLRPFFAPTPAVKGGERRA